MNKNSLDERKFILKKLIKPIYEFFLNIGFNPRNLISAIINYPRFLSELSKFKKLGGVITHKQSQLLDYNDNAGASGGHYFHQDLLVAKFIYENNPDNHIDIGSRIDGFVAHVATFRLIQIFDIRNLKKYVHQNIKFFKKDLMRKESIEEKITDSVSCLHAIEHFGLGRYGDAIDPNGHIKGFNNITRMLKKGGKLYISFPIGKRNEVHFNAHRVFHPRDIFNWSDNKNNLLLERFDMVDDDGVLHENINIDKYEFNVTFGCGIYTFKKTN
jgi:hypothetical protein